MTADSATPTPPERDPHDASIPGEVRDTADEPTDPHDATIPGEVRDTADEPTAQHDATGRANPRPVAPVAPPPDAPPAGLYRSTRDRMLAGVCGGIAERYGIDAVIVRLAFLASLLIGGAGVLFYIAAAIVIPNPPASQDGAAIGAGAPTGPGNNILRIVVALAVGFAALCGLLTVIAISFAVTVFFGAWPAAIVLIVLAALLAIVAKSRRSAATVLVLIVTVAAPAAAATIADLSIERSAGERTETPLTAAEASEGYRLGLGSLTVDLRRLRLMPGSNPLEVPVRVDIGRAAIVIPTDRCVAWTIRTHLGFGGDVRVLGQGPVDSWAGYSQDRTFRIDHGGGDRRPQVTVDARVGVGEIAVGHSIRQINDDRYTRSSSSTSLRTGACSGKGDRRP